MKKIFILLASVFIALSAYTQQLNLQSQLYFTRLTANPALTAYNGSTNVYGFFRDQWSGVLSHPRLGGGVGEISLWNDRIGTGIEVSSYTGGVSQIIDAKLYYAQKIKLAEGHRLSLGIALGMLQRGTNVTQADREMVNNDPNLNLPRFMLFDMNIGLAYQWKKLTLGFAIPNLLNANVRSYSNQNKIADFKRNYLINGSYEISLANEKFNIEPGFILRINQLKQVGFNLQVMADYKRMVYLGVGYDLFGSLPITAGVKISKIFTLAYTYQVPLMQGRPFAPSIYSTHELTVGICFDKWMKKGDKAKDAAIAAPVTTAYDSLLSQKASTDSLSATQKAVDSLALKLEALEQALANAQKEADQANLQKKEQEERLETLSKKIEAKQQAAGTKAAEQQEQEQGVEKAKATEQQKQEPVTPAEAEKQEPKPAAQQKSSPATAQPGTTTEKTQKLAPEAKSFAEEAENSAAPAAGDRFRLEKVSFGRNGSELSPESYAQLDKLVAYLQIHKSVHVRVAGHTDSRANEEYNGWLSRLRARAVADYLKSKGISPNRIDAVGMGPRMPVADNETEEGRAKNRRVEVEVIK